VKKDSRKIGTGPQEPKRTTGSVHCKNGGVRITPIWGVNQLCHTGTPPRGVKCLTPHGGVMAALMSVLYQHPSTARYYRC